MPFNPDGTYTPDFNFAGLPSGPAQPFPQSPTVNAVQPVVPGQPNVPAQSGIPAPTGFNPYIEGIGAATGVANAYLGFENLKLGKKQFGFAKDSFNKNLANQAQLTNQAIEDQARSRIAASGLHDRSTAAGRTALASDLESYTAPRRVSGAPV